MHGDAPGAVLAGKYELIEKAGRGGMAVVWRARTIGAAGFSRPVAIKRIIQHYSQDPVVRSARARLGLQSQKAGPITEILEDLQEIPDS